MIDEAPKRLWAEMSHAKGLWEATPYYEGEDAEVEYTRADLTPSLEQLKRWEKATQHDEGSFLDWVTSDRAIANEEIRDLIAKLEAGE